MLSNFLNYSWIFFVYACTGAGLLNLSTFVHLIYQIAMKTSNLIRFSKRKRTKSEEKINKALDVWDKSVKWNEMKSEEQRKRKRK